MKSLKNAFSLLLSLLAALACQSPTASVETLPYFNKPDFTPEWSAQGTGHQIAPFAFVNQQGDTVRSTSLEGKMYVANFFFSICPKICPTLMHNLKAVQEKYERNDSVQLVSYSVMPWVDSVGRLRKYATENGITPSKWHLLTGQKEAIYRLARQSYFTDQKEAQKPEDGFIHSENVLLIDGSRRIRGIYNGTLPLEIQRLMEDIEILRKETP